MRAFLLVALLCATALCRAQAQTPIEVTILCDSGYPPYSYEEKARPRGSTPTSCAASSPSCPATR